MASTAIRWLFCVLGLLLLPMGSCTNNQEDLANVFDGVFSEEFVHQLLEESKQVHALVTSGASALKHGKYPTYWFALNQKPRCASERAVQMLFEHATTVLRESDSLNRPDMIIGGEWWVQSRNLDASIGFHYDKDEALASIESKMDFPIVSTVTYLSNRGAPTVVLNQRSLDGNGADPRIPSQANIIYPRRNRHMIFNGTLNHGVVGPLYNILSLSEDSDYDELDDKRVTFLVNWWKRKPNEPNNNVPNAQAITFLTSRSNPNFRISESRHANANFQRLRHYELTVPSPTSPHALMLNDTFPPAEGFFFYMPDIITRGSGLYSIHWNSNQVFGALGILDLKNTNQVSRLFRLQEPKVIVFYSGNYMYQTILKDVLSLTREWMNVTHWYIADVATCGDALNHFYPPVFNVQYPQVIIHDTAKNGYVRLREDFDKTGEFGEWNKNFVSSFINDVAVSKKTKLRAFTSNDL